MKEKMIEKLMNDGYLPDEARRAVEGGWWLVEMYKSIILENENSSTI